MIENGPNGDDGPDRTWREAPLDRRHILAAFGSLTIGALAGCGGGDGDAATTNAPEQTTTTPGVTTSPPSTTTTARSTTTTTGDTSTAEPTTEPTAEPTTTSGPAFSFDAPPVVAPSAAHQPTDGFAGTDWLTRDVPAIVRVTSLAASGEGSLRAALERTGPRIVVFEVGGVINLQGSGIEVTDGAVYVAGQTAPSPGVTLVRGDLVLNCTDAVVQHLRVRPGDEVPEPTDALSVGEQGKNVIVDHSSVSWGTDENMSTGGSSANHTVTFTNNIVAEGLSYSIHPKGEHSKGTLVMNDAREVTIAGGLYATNRARNPRLKGGTSTAVVNNYLFGIDGATSVGGDTETAASASFVGNHYAIFRQFDIVQDASEHLPEVHVADNTVRLYDENGNRDIYQGKMVQDGLEQVDEPPVWPDGLGAVAVEDLEDTVLPAVGARPADRTGHDQRIIDDVRNRVHDGFIDSQSEVGGYPDLEATERTLDPPSPSEGVGSWLAQHTRAVELGESPP